MRHTSCIIRVWIVYIATTILAVSWLQETIFIWHWHYVLDESDEAVFNVCCNWGSFANVPINIICPTTPHQDDRNCMGFWPKRLPWNLITSEFSLDMTLLFVFLNFPFTVEIRFAEWNSKLNHSVKISAKKKKFWPWQENLKSWEAKTKQLPSMTTVKHSWQHTSWFPTMIIQLTCILSFTTPSWNPWGKSRQPIRILTQLVSLCRWNPTNHVKARSCEWQLSQHRITITQTCPIVNPLMDGVIWWWCHYDIMLARVGINQNNFHLCSIDHFPPSH